MANHVHNACGEPSNDNVSNHLGIDGSSPPKTSRRAWLSACSMETPFPKAPSFEGAMSHTSAAKSNPSSKSLGSSDATSYTTGTSSITSANLQSQGISSGMTMHQDAGTEMEPSVHDFNSIWGGFQGGIDPQYLGPTALQTDPELAQHEAEVLHGQQFTPQQGILGQRDVHVTQTRSPKEKLCRELDLLYGFILDPATESLLSEEDWDGIQHHLRQGKRIIEKRKINGHGSPNPSGSKQPRSFAIGNRKVDKGKKKLFRCIKCGTEFKVAGSLHRHVEDKHHPCVNIGCPDSDCREVSRRKDKARDHCLIKHEWKPTNPQLELYTTRLECPPQCSICFLQVNNWKEFYKCFFSHCDIGSSNEDDDSPFEDDAAKGDGPASEDGLNFPDMPADQGHGSYYNSWAQDWWNFQMPNGNQNANQYAHGMHRSSSYGNYMFQPQSDAFHDTNQKRRASAEDDPDLRKFQQLGLPQKQPLKRHKPARAEPQENRRCQICGHVFNSCKLCQKRPVSAEWCHACSDTTRARASSSSSQMARHIGLSDRSMSPLVDLGSIQQQMPYLQNFHIPSSFGIGSHPVPRPSGNYRRPTGNPRGPLRGSNNFTTMTTYVPASELSEEEMLPTGLKSLNASVGGGTWLSCLPFRVSPFPMGMIKVPQKAKALEYGVGSGAIEQAISQTISEPINPQINLPLAKLGTISPELCRCPCRTKTATSTFSSNARVELVPGKVLDMTLTILPEDRVGHPLRTRIRVVVKLLKLRSSVARSGNTKKNKQDAKDIELVLKTSLDGSAPTASSEEKQEEPVTVDESDISESEDDGLFSDAESVTSSVAEASSVSGLALVPFKKSSSDILFSDEPTEDNRDTSDLFSNIQFPDDDSEELHQPNESIPDDLIDGIQNLSIIDSNDFDIQETELEISLDLDLHTCLENLSSWTDGLADIEQSGHITDPTRVFECFFRYIIYVIFALSRSRIEATGR